ncbi:MAG: YihY/virulence factor BrkB family protein [Chloroflexota bacterium]|nr:YihY/virulence factor BrkB family protein [Chloroflexota bacterium]
MDRREFVTVVKATAREFVKDDVGYLAAAVTYYAFFSLFPAILLGVTIAGQFVDTDDAYAFIVERVGRFAPSLSEFLTKTLEEVIEKRDFAGWSALFSSVILFFTATGAFDAIDKAINRAWKSEKMPSIFVTKLTSFLMIVTVSALMLVSLMVSAGLTATRTFTTYLLGDVPGTDFVWVLISFAASTSVVFLGLLLLYRYIPRCTVGLHDVWRAALLAACIWSLAKEGFALYLGSTFATYSAVYGTVGAIVAILTWIYVSVIIILTGAEFSAETAHVRDLREKVQRATLAEQEPSRSPWFSS